jgi:hypothetical protein
VTYLLKHLQLKKSTDLIHYRELNLGKIWEMDFKVFFVKKPRKEKEKILKTPKKSKKYFFLMTVFYVGRY